ncbi:MAG: hypothetical protein IPJ20_26560 [Flammeovirgaceae bacterium]|nr:hypothetical protein [Flammeovirgaceae bacterium]
MILKIFKGIWFFSLIGLLVVFFYVYAGLPEPVSLWEGETPVSMSRNGVFYFSLLLMAVINMMVFTIRNLISKNNEPLNTWFYSLIIAINVFLISSFGLLTVTNGGERYDYGSMAPAVYGSLILICISLLSWPVYRISQRFSSK